VAAARVEPEPIPLVAIARVGVTGLGEVEAGAVAGRVVLAGVGDALSLPQALSMSISRPSNKTLIFTILKDRRFWTLTRLSRTITASLSFAITHDVRTAETTGKIAVVIIAEKSGFKIRR
jgi:hypothetical protein